MKIKFAASRRTLNTIEGFGIDGVTIEGGLLVFDTGHLPTRDALIRLGEIRARVLEESRGADPFDAVSLRMVANRINRTVAQTEATLIENARLLSDVSQALNDGSHSLPTGDESISDASQDSEQTNEKEIENGSTTQDEQEDPGSAADEQGDRDERAGARRRRKSA